MKINVQHSIANHTQLMPTSAAANIPLEPFKQFSFEHLYHSCICSVTLKTDHGIFRRRGAEGICQETSSSPLRFPIYIPSYLSRHQWHPSLWRPVIPIPFIEEEQDLAPGKSGRFLPEPK